MRNQCDFLCGALRLCLADASYGVPSLEDGLWLLLAMAPPTGLATDSRTLGQTGSPNGPSQKVPSAAILHSASRKTSQIGGMNRRYDAGKRVFGRKCFLLVDTLGLLLATRVVAGNVSEKAAAQLLLTFIKTTPPLRKLCRRMKKIWADGG